MQAAPCRFTLLTKGILEYIALVKPVAVTLTYRLSPEYEGILSYFPRLGRPLHHLAQPILPEQLGPVLAITAGYPQMEQY